MANNEKGENARQFYRIHYRAPDNPIFECNNAKFLVIDISEGGIKFVPKKGSSFFENDFIEGKIVFGNRGTANVKGQVLRISVRDVAVRLDPKAHIPLMRIMEEQRFLIQKGRL